MALKGSQSWHLNEKQKRRATSTYRVNPSPNYAQSLLLRDYSRNAKEARARERMQDFAKRRSESSATSSATAGAAADYTDSGSASPGATSCADDKVRWLDFCKRPHYANRFEELKLQPVWTGNLSDDDINYNGDFASRDYDEDVQKRHYGAKRREKEQAAAACGNVESWEAYRVRRWKSPLHAPPRPPAYEEKQHRDEDFDAEGWGTPNGLKEVKKTSRSCSWQ